MVEMDYDQMVQPKGPFQIFFITLTTRRSQCVVFFNFVVLFLNLHFSGAIRAVILGICLCMQERIFTWNRLLI